MFLVVFLMNLEHLSPRALPWARNLSNESQVKTLSQISASDSFPLHSLLLDISV